jgi:heterodisulfide reductase subunit D
LRRGEIQLSEDQAKKFSEHVFRCTLCARCRSVCPVDIDTRGLQMALRESLVDMGHYPKNLDLILDSVNTEHNPLNYPNDERAAFLEWLDDVPEDMYQKEKADVVYFVGCISSFSPAVQSIPEAFIDILNKSGLEFSIMGENEWCCGYPLICGGMQKNAEEVRKHNIEMVKSLGAKTVVASCPSCYNTWAYEYETDLEVFHATQFIQKLINEGTITLNKIEGKAAYHDPCDLARNSDVYDEPREVIKATGLEIVEFPQNRKMGYCCGGGGDLEAVDADIARKSAERFAGIVAKTEVDELITACQQCIDPSNPRKEVKQCR